MKKNVMILFLLIALNLTSAYQFCDNETSEDQLEIISITEPTQEDSENWAWLPTQNVNIEVKLENKNFATRDFLLELFFLNKEDSIKKMTETNLEQTISLEQDKTKTLNFSFQLDSPSLGDYFLYAKLADANNQSICTSLKATSTSDETTITIEEIEKIIVVKNIIGPENITQGSYGIYTVDVANYGNAPEGKISVIAYNANLKIRETQEIENLAIDETKTVTFAINIPENATLGQEKFLFSTEYGYDERAEYYHESSDKEKAFFIQIEKAKTTKSQSETQNKTTQDTTTQSQAPPKPSEKDQGSYFWLILIIIIFSTIIIAALWFLKSRKENNVAPTATEESSDKVKEYVDRIRNS